MAECEVKVDTSEAESQLQQLRDNSDFTAVTVMKTVNKSYQTLRLLGDIFNIALPMWFDLMAQGAIMAGTAFAEMATAETVSGWLAAKAGITFSLSLMMFYRALQIQQEKMEVESKLNSILQIGNIWF